MYEKKRSFLPLLLAFIIIPVVLIIINSLDPFLNSEYVIDSSFILNLRLTRMFAEYALLCKVLAVIGGIILILQILFGSSNSDSLGKLDVVIIIFAALSLIGYILIPVRTFIFKPEVSKVTIQSKAGADSFKFLVSLDNRNVEHTPGFVPASEIDYNQLKSVIFDPLFENSFLYAEFNGGNRGLICVNTYFTKDVGDELYAVDIGTQTYCFNPKYYTVDNSLLEL